MSEFFDAFVEDAWEDDVDLTELDLATPDDVDLLALDTDDLDAALAAETDDAEALADAAALDDDVVTVDDLLLLPMLMLVVVEAVAAAAAIAIDSAADMLSSTAIVSVTTDVEMVLLLADLDEADDDSCCDEEMDEDVDADLAKAVRSFVADLEDFLVTDGFLVVEELLLRESVSSCFVSADVSEAAVDAALTDDAALTEVAAATELFDLDVAAPFATEAALALALLNFAADIDIDAELLFEALFVTDAAFSLFAAAAEAATTTLSAVEATVLLLEAAAPPLLLLLAALVTDPVAVLLVDLPEADFSALDVLDFLLPESFSISHLFFVDVLSLDPFLYAAKFCCCLRNVQKSCEEILVEWFIVTKNTFKMFVCLIYE